MNKTKTCSQCKVEKLTLEFYNNSKNKDGLSYSCKSCSRRAVKQRKIKLRQSNPEAYREQRKAERIRYVKRYPEKTKLASQKRSKKHRKHHVFIHMARDANKRYKNIETITAFDLWQIAKKQKLTCPITGLILTRENISLDHIIPQSKDGRNIPSNIRLIVRRSNKMKDNMLDDEMFELVRLIYEHHAKTKSPRKPGD